MNTIDVDDWLEHLQSEVDTVGDQLHQLITTLLTVGVLVAAAVAIAVLTAYALWHGAP